MRKFPGAKWWKFDFHAHTPASTDYGSGPDQPVLQAISHQDWLLTYMRAGIDCVAITDHNSGLWVDPLKAALMGLKDAEHADYRPLHLFPGVEITAAGGIHILAIFDVTAGTADVTKLLGAVQAKAAYGASDVACDYSPVQVVAEIVKAGAIPILAHVDEPRGMFVEAAGNSLTPVLDLTSLYVMEVRQPTFAKPALYDERKLAWAEVLGSDSHHPAGSGQQRYPGSHYTWVKMGDPTLEGVRLALLDSAPLSIRRSDHCGVNPNSFASLYIEGIEVDEARYCGRGGALVARFNPWLNALIGGRGSGKSSIVEFMRLVLQRVDELTGSLAKSFEEFNQVNATRKDKGALRDNTTIKVRFRKDDVRYIVQWSKDGTLAPILQEVEEGRFERANGEVRQRFPVRIFSQKQVFALSEEGGALMRILDEAPKVNKGDWDHEWDLELTNYLSLQANARAIFAQLSEEGAIKGKLDDVLAKLNIFEKAEHSTLLLAYQSRQRQAQAITSLWKAVTQHEQALRDVAGIMTAPDFDPALFNPEDPADAEILRWANDVAAIVEKMAAGAVQVADAAKEQRETSKAALDTMEWRRGQKETKTAYDTLVATLAAQGVQDPSEFATLVQQRQELEDRLKEMTEIRETLHTTVTKAGESFSRLVDLRVSLTRQRADFLREALAGNQHVRIKVQPFGSSKADVEGQFRAIIGRVDSAFASDILSDDGQQGLIADLYRALPAKPSEAATELLKRLKKVKTDLFDAARRPETSRFGAWLTKHLQQLPPESFDRISTWFPEDALSVEYSPNGDGREFRPLEQGSPGQKTAAILAFILAHGNEPIVLDQPEDDLDNHLIYDLIVSQIRENKLRRQVIVVTHNPNIVVNGDAEAVFAMGYHGGQCRIVAEGCLQSKEVRETVCQIMEGGKDAFQKRYRRIIGSV